MGGIFFIFIIKDKSDSLFGRFDEMRSFQKLRVYPEKKVLLYFVKNSITKYQQANGNG